MHKARVAMRRVGLCMIVLTSPFPVFAAEGEVNASVAPSEPASTDPAFAPSGHAMVSVATGLPYLAIGEVAYGVGSRFTVGVLGGITPTTEGGGVRIRGVLLDFGVDRLVAQLPLLYYPPTRGFLTVTSGMGEDAWFLVMPELQWEHRFGNGTRLHAGVGVAATSCADGLAAFLQRDIGFAQLQRMGDVWPTFKVGGSMPLSHATSLFADVALVPDGLVYGKPWIVGVPLVATVGMAHAF